MDKDRSVSSLTQIRDFIKARAENLGFCLCGFTNASPLQHFRIYQEWIQNNYHGDMKYLASERHLNPRQDPKLLVPWAKTIVVLAWPYQLPNPEENISRGQIAGYAIGEDYHLLIPQKLSALIEEIKNRVSFPFRSQIFTDSSALLERELAVRAGLGWVGKNSCVINKKFGSAFLLSEIILDFDLPVDPPLTGNFCGTCHRCIDACPTHCIQKNRTINARDCISTLTIENKGAIPNEMRSPIGNHLFGCDICQSVCPWNHAQIISQNEASSLSIDVMLEELTLNDQQFKDKYAISPILRAKRRGWIRNLCAVIGNLHFSNAIPVLEKLLENEHDPVILSSITDTLGILKKY
jgi:epoxyqueuosine reductase